MKKFAVCIMICFVLFSLFGCATVDASVRVLRNGQVEQKIDIIFNKTELAAAGYTDFNGFLSTVKSVVQNVVAGKELSYYNNLQALPRTNADELRVYSILSNSNAAGIDDKSYTNGFRIVKQFGNVYAFMFYNYHEEFTKQLKYNRLVDVPLAQDGSLDIDNEGFIADYIEKCYTVYYGQAGLMQEIADAVNLAAGGSFTVSDADLIFRLITPYKRLHSDGEITFNGENYVHTWNISNPDNTITVFRTTSKPVFWYLLALGLSVLAIAIGLLYHKLRKPNPMSAKDITHMAEDINNMNRMNYNNDKNTDNN